MTAFWGPEIRLMVFSGLIDRVASEREVVLLSRVTDGGFVERLPKGCRLEPLVVDSMPQGLCPAVLAGEHGPRNEDGSVGNEARIGRKCRCEVRSRRLAEAAPRVGPPIEIQWWRSNHVCC